MCVYVMLCTVPFHTVDGIFCGYFVLASISFHLIVEKILFSESVRVSWKAVLPDLLQMFQAFKYLSFSDICGLYVICNKFVS